MFQTPTRPRHSLWRPSLWVPLTAALIGACTSVPLSPWWQLRPFDSWAFDPVGAQSEASFRELNADPPRRDAWAAGDRSAPPACVSGDGSEHPPQAQVGACATRVVQRARHTGAQVQAEGVEQLHLAQQFDTHAALVGGRFAA